MLEGLPAGVRTTAGGDLHGELGRGAGRVRPERPAAARGRPRRGARGRPSRPTMGSPVAVTITNAEFESKYRELMGVEGPPDPGEALTARDPGTPTSSGCAEVRVRRRAERARAGQRAGDRGAGGGRMLLQGVPGGLGVHVAVPRGADRAAAGPGADRRCPADLDGVDGPRAVRGRRRPPSGWSTEIRTGTRSRDTLGGVFEVLAYGVPPGLGSHVQFDRKLDARLALALMSIQSVKGVEVGDGFARRPAPGRRPTTRSWSPRRPPAAQRPTGGRDRGRHEHRGADPASAPP